MKLILAWLILVSFLLTVAFALFYYVPAQLLAQGRIAEAIAVPAVIPAACLLAWSVIQIEK
ncbi:MAG: hypothetical protein ACYS7Y_30680 [Planctomycetota bacterium]|jgi:hypothetical protein